MQAGNSVDSYACVFAHCCPQSDADQAYGQARLNGFEAWIALPREAWPLAWLYGDGTPMYNQPVIRLLRALFGHPGAGTFWEHHCDEVIVKQIGVEPVVTWPSCYYHSSMAATFNGIRGRFQNERSRTVHGCSVDMFTNKHIETEEPAVAILYLGCKHRYSNLKTKSVLVKKVLHDMKDEVFSSVNMYQKLCIAATGKEATLRQVTTPFIEEGQARALAKAFVVKRTLH